jgi:2-oxoglutarate dehydrogenase E2 component (dihydrolipoamide succinyltransferase)
VGDIRLPRLNATDEEYTLLEWLVGDGASVGAGTAVALVETSKAAHELVAEEAGTLWQRIHAPSTCRPGEVVATVARDDRPVQAQRNADPDPITITRPARQLMVEYGVAEETVRSIGKVVISRSDIEQLVAGQAGPAAVERVPVSAAQRRVARTVSASHREIPAAYSVVKVVADRLKQRLRDEAATVGFLGVPELVVKAIAARRKQFGLFFAHAVDDQTVVADADTRPLRDISADLLRFRLAAMRGDFTEADLTGSNIAFAIHADADIVYAQPLIFPEHMCALSLASMQRELILLDDGSVTSSEYFHLGLAYDHRFVNGRSAVAFLHAVKADLESGG